MDLLSCACRYTMKALECMCEPANIHSACMLWTIEYRVNKRMDSLCNIT